MSLYDSTFSLLCTGDDPLAETLHALALPADQLHRFDIAMAPDGGAEPVRVYGSDRRESRVSSVRLTARAAPEDRMALQDLMDRIEDFLDNIATGTYPPDPTVAPWDRWVDVAGRAVRQEHVREISVADPVRYEGQDELKRVVLSLGIAIEHKEAPQARYDILWPVSDETIRGIDWPGV